MTLLPSRTRSPLNPPEEKEGTDWEYKPVEREFDYTEHDAVITYRDGHDRRVTFDVMNRGEHGITLKDYTGEVETSNFGIGTPARAFLFIPYGALRDFETVERRQESIEYTTRQRVPVEDGEE